MYAFNLLTLGYSMKGLGGWVHPAASVVELFVVNTKHLRKALHEEELKEPAVLGLVSSLVVGG